MAKEQLYKKFAKYYDKIYSKKDSKKEVEFIEWAIKKHKKSRGKKLLDIACGTGRHAILLKKNYLVLGVDISNEMLKIARKRVKGVKFVIGDMKKLDLKQKFDVIICMFSAINYNTNYKELEKTLRNFYNHLQNDGIVVYDLGFNKESWIEGYMSADTIVEKNLQLARISQSRSENNIFNVNFIFLVKENGKFNFEIDQHKLGIFETEKVRKLMNKIGFKTFTYTDYTNKIWNRKLKKRPIFVGIK